MKKELTCPAVKYARECMLDRAAAVETGLDGGFTADDELFFPLGRLTNEHGFPLCYFIVQIDDAMERGGDWESCYSVDLIDDSCDDEDDIEDAWLPARLGHQGGVCAFGLRRLRSRVHGGRGR